MGFMLVFSSASAITNWVGFAEVAEFAEDLDD
jgi:hypothetical protein